MNPHPLPRSGAPAELPLVTTRCRIVWPDGSQVQAELRSARWLDPGDVITTGGSHHLQINLHRLSAYELHQRLQAAAAQTGGKFTAEQDGDWPIL
jgi:urease accessory protein UreE